MDGDSLVVDWHFAVDVATSGFGSRSNQLMYPPQTQGRISRRQIGSVSVKNHGSCGIGTKKGMSSSITLEDCLDAFAKEERIPEAYCSKCNEFRVQTKRMSLWRLPPIVIIHLKRFQFTQHMRRKLRELVVFPVEGLDLSRIMASDSSPTVDGGDDSQPDNVLPADADNETSVEESLSPDADSATPEPETAAPAMSPSSDKGRSHKLYDLYGVVHHQGALSGGHYVASLKSEIDGQWRLYNDATILEIHNHDVVDPSAYILFYIRRDVKDAKLSDLWDTSAGPGEGLTEEDMEKLIRGRSDRCIIS